MDIILLLEITENEPIILFAKVINSNFFNGIELL